MAGNSNNTGEAGERIANCQRTSSDRTRTATFVACVSSRDDHTHMYWPEEDRESDVAVTVIISSLPVNVPGIAGTHSYLWAHA